MELLLVAFALSVLHALYRFTRSKRSSTPLPPGPKPIPFVGNLHQMPRVDPSQEYTRWTKLYGDVIYMHVFGREFVILNSLEATTDLFEKRSGIYSTRPRLVMAGELVGREKTSILFTKYGARLRQCRKLLHGWINTRSTMNYLPAQEVGRHKLLGFLLESPENFSRHVRASAGSVILKLTYGIDTLPVNDPYIAMSEELSKITAKASQPGRWMVDSFPSLSKLPSWFPGAGFKRWAKHARQVSTQLVKIPYDMVLSQVMQETAPNSWTATQLRTESTLTENDAEALICAAGSIYAGGIDTVVSLIRTFFLMMARHPEIQRKAQMEIDSVIGTKRLPELNDRNSLPYIECLIKELLRINPIVPLIPHSLDADDIYKGWRIPKGAWVMANLRAILNDPSAYTNPEEFRPERFDTSLGGVAERDPTEASFGFGRRFCPGYQFAQSAIFLNISGILATFDISPIIGADGKPQPPPFAFDVGHLSAPSPFQCNVTPRSEEKVSLIRQVLADI